MKGLFSVLYYDEETFWKQFNKKRYDALRKKYKAEKSFLNIYDKVCTGLKSYKKKET